MIIEWLLEISATFMEWWGSQFPEIEVEDWVENPFGGLGWIVDAGAGWGVWINVPVLVVVTTLVLTVYAAGFVFKLARVIAGHLPFVGGNG